VEAERRKRSAAAVTAKDDAVLAIAYGALRSQMLDQVQAILATFDLSRLPTVTE
jgi:hypothetical protein